MNKSNNRVKPGYKVSNLSMKKLSMIAKASQQSNFNEFMTKPAKDKENKSIGKRKKTKPK